MSGETGSDIQEVSDSPIVVLFEDRPKQCMVYQLNLSVYLDARVVIANDLTDLKRAMAGPEGLQLIIVRSNFKGGTIVNTIADFLKESGQKIPVISLGGGPERPELVVVGDDTLVKPMLQTAAKILGVTARKMVGKVRPDFYKISPDFLKLLFTVPCDVYEESKTGNVKVFSVGDAVARGKVNRFARNKRNLIIYSFERLRLANAVTEQSLKASEEMHSEGLNEEKKMNMLSASLDMVGAQFRNAGMDAETVDLANASIKAIEKIAETSTNVGNLVRQLMDSEGGYRYAHSQLLTFLGFHVIKMMGWWGDDQRAIISQAAFYHDVSLETDDEGKIRSDRDLSDSGIKDPKRVETILSHAQLAARELQAMPEISPEVVRVVIQHHGSPIGRGYSTDLSKLENLTKAFILAEEWGDYLIALSDTDAEPDNEGKAAELKSRYKDEVAHQIIETFRYLQPDAFAADFLEATPMDVLGTPKAAAEEAAPEQAEEAEKERAEKAAPEQARAAAKKREGAYRGEGNQAQLSEEEETELLAAGIPEGSAEMAAIKRASPEIRKVMLEKVKKKAAARKATAAGAGKAIEAGMSEAEKQAASASSLEELKELATFKNADKETQEAMIEAQKRAAAATAQPEVEFAGDGSGEEPAAKAATSSTGVRKDGSRKIEAGSSEAEAETDEAFFGDEESKPDEKKFAAGGKVADPTKRVKGAADVRKDEERRIGASGAEDPDEAEETFFGDEESKPEEKKFAAGDRTKDPSKRVKGATDVRKDEERRFGASGAEDPDETEETFFGDEESKPEEKKIAAGDRTKDPSKRVKGTTDVRKDEERRFGASGSEEADEEEQSFSAESEEPEEERVFGAEKRVVDPSKRVKGVTDVRKDEEQRFGASKEEVDDSEQRFEGGDENADEEEQRFTGEKHQADNTKRNVSGVTDKISDGQFLSKGGKLEVDRTKRVFTNTDPEKRVDDKGVPKDPSQKYVDRSLVKTKIEGGKEAERELKLKSVTGATELMKAALAGSLENITELLTTNVSAQVRKTDVEGRTCLHYAAMGGSLPVLKYLIEKGAQLNAVDAKRRSALFLSALHKQNDAFDFILAQGAKIGQQAMGGMNIAMVAGFTGNLHILKIAVQKKVRLDTRDHSGKTVKDYAKMAKATDILNFLEALDSKAAAKRAAVPGGMRA